MERARHICRRWWNRLYRPFVLRRIARPSSATVRGRALLTDPEVFHPVYFASTAILLGYLDGLALAKKRVLDMGTGSGAIGIAAAADHGAIVTACDVNASAVRLAGENARRAGAAVEVVESDLYGALGGRTFDVVCFNVPFYARAPRTPFEAAFFAGPELETIRRFAADSPRFLAPAGSVVVLFSEDCGRERMLALFAQSGFHPADERITTKFFERFHVVRFVRAAAGAAPI